MKKALVVDDTKNIRLLLQKTLEIEGFSVETATTGKEALDKITADSFGLIFLDIKLPEVSGTEVLRKIRADGINTPVIIITAYPTVKNAVDCVQLGAITYLQKPFTAERLKNILKQFNFSSDSEETDTSDLWIASAKEALSSGDWKKALSQLSSLLSENPANAEVYKLMSEAYRLSGDKTNAEKFQKVFEIMK